MSDLIIVGPPRTKKNHGRRKHSFRTGLTYNVASEAYELWEQRAIPQMKVQWVGKGRRTITERVNVVAFFYLDNKTEGDPVGYYQGLADALQKAKVVLDDRLCASWDGSRVRRDPAYPRVEVTFTEASL